MQSSCSRECLTEVIFYVTDCEWHPWPRNVDIYNSGFHSIKRLKALEREITSRQFFISDDQFMKTHHVDKVLRRTKQMMNSSFHLLRPNNCTHIHHNVLYTFPVVLKRRIYFKKLGASWIGGHFPYSGYARVSSDRIWIN